MKRFIYLASLIPVLAFLWADGALAQQKRVVLGGNPPGSVLFAMASGFSSIVTKHTGIKLDIFPQGQTVYFPMMETGEVDMGIVNSIDAGFAYRGEAPYKKVTQGKGFNFRTLMAGSPFQVSVVASERSGIKTLADLKGKRMVVEYGRFFGAGLTARSALANAGLTIKDIIPVKVTSTTEGIRAVIEGRADVATAAVGMGIVRELKLARGARLLAIDPSPAAMKRVQKIAPGFSALPAKPNGVEVLTTTIVFTYPLSIMVRRDLDKKTVKTVIRAFWDHYKELQPIHPRLRQWTPDRFATTGVVIPYHPAAIEFYKEKGVWTKEIDAHNKSVIK
jgi:TRAP transporter TAXI family solute receptor